MRIDNFYFVVSNIEKSIEFYSKLFGKEPSNVVANRWADWGNENNQVYFGIISVDATGCELIKGNNGVLGLYVNNIEEALDLCKSIDANILYKVEEIPNSIDNYKCFAIEDLDGNKIEISCYDKK